MVYIKIGANNEPNWCGCITYRLIPVFQVPERDGCKFWIVLFLGIHDCDFGVYRDKPSITKFTLCKCYLNHIPRISSSLAFIAKIVSLRGHILKTYTTTCQWAAKWHFDSFGFWVILSILPLPSFQNLLKSLKMERNGIRIGIIGLVEQ